MGVALKRHTHTHKKQASFLVRDLKGKSFQVNDSVFINILYHVEEFSPFIPNFL